MTPSLEAAMLQSVGVMSATSAAQSIAAQLARRRLAAPALLLLTAFRPLHFAAGHALLIAAPLAELIGLTAVATYAAVLTEPTAVAALQNTLEQAVDGAGTV